MPASTDVDATSTPAAIEDSLSGVTYSRFTTFNADTTAVVLMRTAATQPSATARGALLFPGDDIETIPETGLKTWVWTTDPNGAALIVETFE